MATTTGDRPQADEWPFEQLQAEAEDLRTRLNRFRTSLGRFFVDKQELIDLMVVTAVAQEPLLLVGPPGTAKSDLVLKFKDALGLADDDYFEYMLTRFTEPSEIIGPIDINQLRDGRYSPFAKRHETADQLTADQLAADGRALERFVAWAGSRRHDRLSVFFTPWGEALTHRSYRRAIATLSRLPQIAKVAVQTNLSCTLDWIDRCDATRLGLWCTYHPGQASRRTFVGKCLELSRRRVPYSVGVVGLKEHFDQIESLRRELPAEIYLWINAHKERIAYYDQRDVRRCEAVDPHFHINSMHHPSRGRRCRAGRAAISVDGEGTVRRCHFVDRPLGNLYDRDVEDLLQAGTCPNDVCGCHIGYVYLEHLELGRLFGDGLLERIPA